MVRHHVVLAGALAAGLLAAAPAQPQECRQAPQDPPRQARDRKPRSKAYLAILAWHEGVRDNEVRLSLIRMPDGQANVALLCVADLKKGEATTWREVYDWAKQAHHTRQLTQAQRLTLERLVKEFPISAPEPDGPGGILVSVRRNGKALTRVYKAPEVLRLFDSAGGVPPDASLCRRPLRWM
jgi:hypothetical protein